MLIRVFRPSNANAFYHFLVVWLVSYRILQFAAAAEFQLKLYGFLSISMVVETGNARPVKQNSIWNRKKCCQFTPFSISRPDYALFFKYKSWSGFDIECFWPAQIYCTFSVCASFNNEKNPHAYLNRRDQMHWFGPCHSLFKLLISSISSSAFTLSECYPFAFSSF